MKVLRKKGGRWPQKWFELARTRTWVEAVRRASGGLSNSDLDLAVAEGTDWANRRRIDRIQLFARAQKRLPGRGKHSVGLEIDVVALAEERWPGTEAIFEHPIWRCWGHPPTSFTDAINTVDVTLDTLGLHRDRSAVEHCWGVVVMPNQYPEEIARFQQSLIDCLPGLAELDRLWLVTTLFREADYLRLPTFHNILQQLRELLFEFRVNGLGKDQNDVIIETALLYRRGDVLVDEMNTVLSDGELLAPISKGRVKRELWVVHPKNARKGGWP